MFPVFPVFFACQVSCASFQLVSSGSISAFKTVIYGTSSVVIDGNIVSTETKCVTGVSKRCNCCCCLCCCC